MLLDHIQKCGDPLSPINCNKIFKRNRKASRPVLILEKTVSLEDSLFLKRFLNLIESTSLLRYHTRDQVLTQLRPMDFGTNSVLTLCMVYDYKHHNKIDIKNVLECSIGVLTSI